MHVHNVLDAILLQQSISIIELCDLACFGISKGISRC